MRGRDVTTAKLFFALATIATVGPGGSRATAESLGANYDGTLDTTLQPSPFSAPFFGIPGFLEFAIDAGGIAPYTNDDESAAMLVQPDGKIVVVGYAWAAAQPVSKYIGYMQRYLPDGNLDTAFGSNGRVTSEWFGVVGEVVDAHLLALALQADGKLVVGGWLHMRNANVDSGIVMRYNANGSFDSAFGQGSIPSAGGAVAKVLIGADGGIYAIGEENSQNGWQINATFLDTDGVLVNDINQSVGSGAGDGDRAYDAVLQIVPSQVCGDGCIIPAHEEIFIVGSSYRGTYPSGIDNHDCAILALRRNFIDTQFSVDTQFNVGGALLVDFPMPPANEGDNYCRSVVARPGGGIVVGGENFYISTLGGGTPGLASNYALAEIDLDANVTRQDAFAWFQEPATPGVFNGVFDMAREPNGKLVLTGYSGTTVAGRAPSDIGVIRFNADFTRDATFGNDGLGLAALSLDGESFLHTSQREWANTVALDNRGHIVLVGQRSYDLAGGNPNDYDWLIARLSTNDEIFRDSLDGVIPVL
ncbi:MAG: hypothetical protein ACREPX_07635 [Rhodanobacteraceae bacterium]